MCSQVLAWGPAFLNVTLHHFALTCCVYWVRAHNPICDSQQFYFPVSRIFECNFMIDSMYHQPCKKKKIWQFFLETSLNICQKITYSWCLCPDRHTSSKLKKLTNVRCPQIWHELPSVKMKIQSCTYRHGLLFIDNSGEIPVHESNKGLEILKMNLSYYQTLQE